LKFTENVSMIKVPILPRLCIIYPLYAPSSMPAEDNLQLENLINAQG